MERGNIESRFGLTENIIARIKEIIFRDENVKDAILFGSRAKGNWKKFSDIDIALVGSEISHDTLVHVISDLEETTIPFTFDIIRYSAITNPDLKDHIDRSGVSFRDLTSVG